ncbi:hypothetical protein [Gynuella sunshinyii]|uniref:Zinc-finger domain-containing protein n=1 Tax=Gynuella sunshinyii YC6258 TaxID=1445510 RepID=A0A0C5VR32_9GAMM|nr:hypothetical protein [Gynuella sunshinyii]AJQ95858.1 hypothetical Protein YC6258_03822 [Gynuella sunshinyii YC6258]
MTAGEAKHRHLTENDLHEYAQDPTQASLENQRQHLENCSECRTKAHSMQQARAIVEQHLSSLNQQSDRESLKRLVYQQAHTLALAEYLRPTDLRTKKRYSWRSIITFLKPDRSWFFVIPMTALLTFMVGRINLWNEEVVITTFGSDHTQLANSPSANVSQALSFIGFHLSHNRKTHMLDIKWQSLEGVNQYRLELYEMVDTHRQLVKAAETRQTHWGLEYPELKVNQLYELNLSGQTDEGIPFHFHSGFVLKKDNK